MTISQHTHSLPLSGGAVHAREARLLRTRRAGCLTVAAGQVWLTRQGDLDDHVLSPGQTVCLRADERVVVEPWASGTLVQLAWCSNQPRARALRWVDAARAGVRALRAAVLRRTGAAESTALARNAAASASRAQGCIACGESSASSGGLQ